ncbi:LysM peptidoglycan-binding domain-containing protein [Chloroflexota bacterium]
MKKATLVMLVCALLFVTSAQVVSAAPASTCGVTHVVKRGQNLYRIAAKYGTTVKAIVKANGLWNPNYIYTGQRLYIPCGKAPTPKAKKVHVVRRGQTLAGIARWYGVSVKAIVKANKIKNPNRIYVGQRLVIPKKSKPQKRGFWYKVRRGDTLSSIAWRFGANMWAIVYANNIRYPSYIYTGQRIWIP